MSRKWRKARGLDWSDADGFGVDINGVKADAGDVFEAGGGDLLAGAFEADAERTIIVGVNPYLNHAALVCPRREKVKGG